MFHADFECYMEKAVEKGGFRPDYKIPCVQHNGTWLYLTVEAAEIRPEGFKQEWYDQLNFRKMTLEAGTRMDLRKKRQQ